MTRKSSPAPAAEAATPDAGVLASMPQATDAAPSGEFHPAMPLEDLVESEANPRKRFDPAGLRELEESIRAKGVLTPLLARPKNDHPLCRSFELAAGHRRFRAAKAAGLRAVPVVVRPMTDAEFLEVIVIENLQRADLHPLEEADGYIQLHEKHGYDVERLAAKVGKSKAYVYARMKLAALPEGARKLFYEGKLNPSTALLVARIPDPKLAEEAARTIVKPNQWNPEPMAYRLAAEYVHERFMLQLSSAPWPKADAELLPSAGACGPCPKRTGNAPDLFGDVRGADVCTDPACFKAKGNAWSARLLVEAQASGREVLGKDEAAKIFERYDGKTLKRSGAWLDLQERCDADPKWKPGRTTPRSWGKVLGDKAPAVTVAVDGAGVVRELIRRSDATDALKAAGVKVGEIDRREITGSSRQSIDREAKARRERATLQRKVADIALAEIVARAEQVDGIKLWRWLAAGMASHVWNDLKKRLAARRGLEMPKHRDLDKAIVQHIEGLSEAGIRGLFAEFVAARNYPGEYSGGYGDEMKKGASLLGVNLASIEKRVRAEKAKPAGKKKARR
jgi:ParB/RepB/Spo0J family partition protein